jgi:hypothetical protein
MREASQGRFARLGRAVARGNAGQIREASPEKCARQFRTHTRGKAKQGKAEHITA